jgi:hypothetical protein
MLPVDTRHHLEMVPFRPQEFLSGSIFPQTEVFMKRLFLVLALLAFAAVPPLTIAQEKSTKPAKAEKVYCCHEKGHEKGKCDKLHTKSECEKEGGRVVKDCKECK